MNAVNSQSFRNIVYNPQDGTITLYTKNTGYQMKIDKYGSLLHTWYGAKPSGRDLSYLIDYSNHSFSGNPADAAANRAYSFDTLPQEYPQEGTGDFRVTGLQIKWPNGSRGTDLRYYSHQIYQGKNTLPGLPSFRNANNVETLVVILKDKYSELYVELYYSVYPDSDLITRSSKVINRTEQLLSINNLSSATLDFIRGDYNLVHFAGRHNLERQITETPLKQGIFSITSSRGTSSHQHNPAAILKKPETTENQGEAYAIALVYSGGFYFDCEKDQIDQTRIVVGMDKQILNWPLNSGESLQSPEVALTYSCSGINGVSQNLHTAIKQNLLPPNSSLVKRPVLINNWEATYFDFTKEKLLELAGIAKELNLDLFVLDDGWFGKRNDDTAGLGDWTTNEQKLGGNLADLVREINKIGLDFGIWIEPEMVNEDSDLYRKHPEWAIQIPARKPNVSRGQLVLDFANPEVQDYLINCIDSILSQAPIKYIKWDMNRSICDWYSGTLRSAEQGKQAHLYVLGVYRVLDYLVTKYPKLLLEGCSGGGGRFDLGMLYYQPQIWTSDDTDAVERLKIQAGTASIYPVSTISAHVSAVPNHQNHRITPLFTRGLVAMQGAFGYELDLSKLNAEEKQTIKQQISFYKKHEALIRTGIYYRLTVPQMAAWEFAAADATQALLVSVYLELPTSAMSKTVLWKGLKKEARYQVTEYIASGKRVLGQFYGQDLMLAGTVLPQPACEHDAVCLLAEITN